MNIASNKAYYNIFISIIFLISRFIQASNNEKNKKTNFLKEGGVSYEKKVLFC